MQLLGLGTILTLLFALAALESILPHLRPARPSPQRSLANALLSAGTLGMNVALASALAVGAAAFASRGLLAPLRLDAWTTVTVAIVALDLSTYAAHRSMHAIPALWRIHRVHHADPHVDVTTSFRQHPLEVLVRFAFVIVPALALGLPPYAIAAYRIASAINALLEHVNVRLWQPLDTLLSFVVVTPNMHKVHHSRRREETDSNYGNLLSLFDRLFRTFTPTGRAARVAYGLEGHDHADDQRVGRLLLLPFSTHSTKGGRESA